MTTETERTITAAVVDATPLQNVSLASRAMLAKFTRRMWSASKHDKKVSNEVADNHGATRDAGRYMKRLTGAKDKNNAAKAAFDAIKSIATEAYQYHILMTRSWLDNGDRILSVDAYGTYTAKMADFEDKFYAAVRAFVPLYPQLVQDARTELNGMWNPSDYPPQSDIASYFSIGVNTFPMPTAEDFRADIGELEVQRVRRQLSGVIENAIAESNRELYGRIFKVVAHMAERLRIYKVTPEGVENTFHASLVENVREQMSVLPLLNITDDPYLAQIAADIEANLTQYDAGTLKDSERLRKQTQVEAERILRHVSEFLA